MKTLNLHSCPVEVANMISLNIKHNELTAEEFILLWESVWGKGPSPEQTQLAMEHTLFRVSVFDGNTIIAMARVIGDLGLDYYIKDVVVRPEYQGQGIGRLMINEILKFINDHGVPGTDIFVELCAMPDKIPFYEKFGFSANEAQRLRKYLRVCIIRKLFDTPSCMPHMSCSSGKEELRKGLTGPSFLCYGGLVCISGYRKVSNKVQTVQQIRVDAVTLMLVS